MEIWPESSPILVSNPALSAVSASMVASGRPGSEFLRVQGFGGVAPGACLNSSILIYKQRWIDFM